MLEETIEAQKTAVEMLAEHLGLEYTASIKYKQFCIAMRLAGLDGFAEWFDGNSKEELWHADKIIDYLIKRKFTSGFTLGHEATNAPGAEISYLPIKTLVSEYFEEALALEKQVAASINDIMNVAVEEKDNATIEFLGWYVSDQVDAIKKVSDILKQLSYADDNGMLFLDAKLAKENSTGFDFED